MQSARRPATFLLLVLLIAAGVLFSFLARIDTINPAGEFRASTNTQSIDQQIELTQPAQQIESASQPLQEITIGTNERIIYIYGTGLVARKDSQGIAYHHQDYLSSNRFASDANGRLVSKNVQGPYGATFEDVGTSAALQNDYSFTGKEQDDRLYYFGARYYDPRTGRFVSVDPVADATTTPYSYAANNPLKFVDVDGRAPKSEKEKTATLVIMSRDVEKIILEQAKSLPQQTPTIFTYPNLEDVEMSEARYRYLWSNAEDPTSVEFPKGSGEPVELSSTDIFLVRTIRTFEEIPSVVTEASKTSGATIQNLIIWSHGYPVSSQNGKTYELAHKDEQGKIRSFPSGVITPIIQSISTFDLEENPTIFFAGCFNEYCVDTAAIANTFDATVYASSEKTRSINLPSQITLFGTFNRHEP